MSVYTDGMDTKRGTNEMRAIMLRRLHEMTPITQIELGKLSLIIQDKTGLGPTGAMELMYRLGTWLNVNDADSLKYSSDGKSQDQVQTLNT